MRGASGDPLAGLAQAIDRPVPGQEIELTGSILPEREHPAHVPDAPTHSSLVEEARQRRLETNASLVEEGAEGARLETTRQDLTA